MSLAPAGCPCGSRLPYAACCGPLHDGARLAALLRARGRTVGRTP